MTLVQRALVSVSDKTGIVELCQTLAALEIDILSTGGTARLLAEHGIRVTEVADYTGFPEMMDGRVKTLHPRIHAGLLGRRGTDDAVMRAHGIGPIDLLVVNLYPFEATVRRPGCGFAEALENIDIGGPALLRAAATNHAAVTVLSDPADYQPVLAELKANDGGVSAATRFRLAQTAFALTARYDANVSNYLGARNAEQEPLAYPLTYTTQFKRRQTLRYGENPHQSAALYTEPAPPAGALAGARQLQGRPLSYNNLADADAALECVLALDTPACVIVKHANPCGAAQGDSARAAYERAYKTDPAAAFGGIIAFNNKLDGATVWAIIQRQFVEVILAPEVAPDCRAFLALAPRPDVRLLETGYRRAPLAALGLKRISGGLLVQDSDAGRIAGEDLQVVTRRQPAEAAKRRPDKGQRLKVVTRRQPAEAELADLLFAWRVVKYVKSNAIVYAKDGMTLGIGAGQMSRIYSARIAAQKAADEKLALAGAVMASDAFFPFRDGLDVAAAAGIRAVIQPGGSVRDAEVIAAADEHEMAMVFTGMRHFLH